MPKSHFFLALSVTLSTLCVPLRSSAQLTLDSTIVDTFTLVAGLETPFELLWGPDDFLWMTERKGYVSRVNPYTGDQFDLLDLTSTVQFGQETGLLGMTFHPDFDNSPFVYLAYTKVDGNVRNFVLARYEYDGSILQNAIILTDTIRAQVYHNGSRLLISNNNKLLATTGDALNAFNALNINSLNGKILRYNLDGSIPADNPYAGSPVWSYGHRNPQGLAYGPSGYLYSTEHGTNSDDEFQIIYRDKSYGWPNVWGYCDSMNPIEAPFCGDTNLVEPLVAFTPSIAPSDIYWYDHPAIPEFQNSFLMAVLKDKMLMRIELNASGDQVVSTTNFLKNKLGRLRDVCSSPDGRVFLATNGQVYGGSPPPTNRIIVLENPTYVHPVSCAVPQDLQTQILNPNSVRLSWSQSVSATAYVVSGKSSIGNKSVNFYVPDGGTTSVDVGNLNTSLTYFWSVRAICNDGPTPYAAIQSFHLGDSIPCIEPGFIFHTNATATTVELNWALAAGVSGYEIAGRRLGSSGIVRLITPGTQSSLMVSNLDPGAGYEWSVRSICDALQTLRSDYAQIDTFFTAMANKNTDQPVMELADDILFYPNPFSSNFSINLAKVDIIDYNLYITDMNGSVLRSYEGQTTKTLTINLLNLQPGVYFYKLTGSDIGVKTGKITKLH